MESIERVPESSRRGFDHRRELCVCVCGGGSRRSSEVSPGWCGHRLLLSDPHTSSGDVGALVVTALRAPAQPVGTPHTCAQCFLGVCWGSKSDVRGWGGGVNALI